MAPEYVIKDWIFQSTHSVWSGTQTVAIRRYRGQNFNPPTPCGVGPFIDPNETKNIGISIHPLRVEWDCPKIAVENPTPIFQSTHSVWSGTTGFSGFFSGATISIHPLRVEWDDMLIEAFNATGISIHPLRVEWDVVGKWSNITHHLFQSTHSVWSGTILRFLLKTETLFQSTHSVWSGTVYFHPENGLSVFQSTHSVWSGTMESKWKPSLIIFQSTHSVWSGTALTSDQKKAIIISIHPLRVEWDCIGLTRKSSGKNFNPPTPCGVGQKTDKEYGDDFIFQSTHSVWSGTRVP